MAGFTRGIVTLLALVFLTIGPAAAQAPKPVSPQPTADTLNPGLAVKYYFHLFRHIDELIEWQDYKDGKEGKPISKLDYRVGQGEVLTSTSRDGVGAEITGLILLQEEGSYAFSVQSNDGVRLEIGGVMVLEDPDVHADRFSNVATLQVTTPGWYPIKILYFERKNTSTLELYWQPPSDSAGSMKIVPSEMLAHL